MDWNRPANGEQEAPPDAVVPKQGRRTGSWVRVLLVVSVCCVLCGRWTAVRSAGSYYAVPWLLLHSLSHSHSLPEVRSEGFPCAGSGGKVAGLVCTMRSSFASSYSCSASAADFLRRHPSFSHVFLARLVQDLSLWSGREDVRPGPRKH